MRARRPIPTHGAPDGARSRTRFPMRPTVRLLLAALCAMLSACMSTNNSSGQPIDAAKVAQIAKGKTTRAEVEALLGKPEATVLVGDGRRMLSYNYSQMNMRAGFAGVKGTTRVQSLQVFVDRDGVVQDYELSDNVRDVKGNMLGGNVQSAARQP